MKLGHDVNRVIPIPTSKSMELSPNTVLRQSRQYTNIGVKVELCINFTNMLPLEVVDRKNYTEKFDPLKVGNSISHFS